MQASAKFAHALQRRQPIRSGVETHIMNDLATRSVVLTPRLSGVRIMSQHLTDSIYEAAFVPEQWNCVLDAVAKVSGAASGSLLVFTGPQAAPRLKARRLPMKRSGST